MKQSISQDMLRAAAAARPHLGRAAGAVAQFALGRLNDDGGFRGRSDAGDLYYTVFGIECVLATGHELPAGRIEDYLHRFGGGESLDFIHLTCLARCWSRVGAGGLPPERREEILDRIEQFRSGDGGYGTLAPGGESGSAFGCFLAAMAREDLGADVPQPGRLAECLAALRTADGAYANDRRVEAGTTTATAAAVVLLRHLGLRTSAWAADWLGARAHESGGFLAGADAPMPDLLSTATALYALKAGRAGPVEHAERHLAFIEGLWDESGGFCGSLADPTSDCEYTWYALLGIGCLTDGT